MSEAEDKVIIFTISLSRLSLVSKHEILGAELAEFDIGQRRLTEWNLL